MQQVTTWLREHQEAQPFVAYLNRKVFKAEAMRKWAHVYHPHLPVRTNNICESFFRELKDGMRSTRRKRLDAAIMSLAGYHEGFFRNLLSKSIVGEQAHKSAQQEAYERGQALSARSMCPISELLVSCTLQGLKCR